MPESAPPVPSVTMDELVERYRVILLDAYGVLVDGAGALAGADALLQAIRARGREFMVVTNDSSRLPGTSAARFHRLGLAVQAEQIVTSGSLLTPYFREHGLEGARCMVLGPEDSVAYVRDAGGHIVPLDADAQLDALIVGDDEGYPFLPGVEAALSATARQLQRGERVSLILPNPDVIFPRDRGRYGYTSGAVALLIETGLARLFPEQRLVFDRLGKPHRPIFERARLLAGTDELVMVGDQLETDIAGAVNAGIDSALIETGVSTWSPETALETAIRPTYLLRV